VGVVRAIAISIMNRRLQEIAVAKDAPFLNATAGNYQWYRVARLVDFDVSYGPDGALPALRGIHDAYADILRGGVRQDEVDEAIRETRTALQATATAAKTFTNTALANSYLNAICGGTVIRTPEENSLIFEQAVQNLHAEQVTEALREMVTGNPAVFLLGPTSVDGAEAVANTLFSAPLPATQIASEAPAAPIPVWPYASFGTPATIAAQETIDDLGTTFVTFANGVRATVKPTKFTAGQVQILVRFGDGRLGLPKGRKSPTWGVGGALISGGLNRISYDDMHKAFADKEWKISVFVADNSYEFVGTTRDKDLDTELQILAAYFTDAAWRPEGFRRIQAAELSNIAKNGATADGLFGEQSSAVAHDNDLRWQTPTADEVRSARLEDVKALLEDAIAKGRLEITIVGDVTADQAIQSVQATFGALPTRHLKNGPPGDERQPAAKEDPIVLRYQGEGDQAIAVIAWPTPSAFQDTKASAALQVLEQVLSQRLFTELRTREGITYSPQVSGVNSFSTRGYGYLSVRVSVPVARIAQFYSAVAKIIADLTTGEIPEAEVERARGPVIGDLEKARQNDTYWLALLGDAQTERRRLDLLRNQIPEIKAVTAADLLSAAKTYLKGDRAWKLIVAPQGFDLSVK
jgi:zinc protease